MQQRTAIVPAEIPLAPFLSQALLRVSHLSGAGAWRSTDLVKEACITGDRWKRVNRRLGREIGGRHLLAFVAVPRKSVQGRTVLSAARRCAQLFLDSLSLSRNFLALSFSFLSRSFLRLSPFVSWRENATPTPGVTRVLERVVLPELARAVRFVRDRN